MGDFYVGVTNNDITLVPPSTTGPNYDVCYNYEGKCIMIMKSSGGGGGDNDQGIHFIIYFFKRNHTCPLMMLLAN